MADWQTPGYLASTVRSAGKLERCLVKVLRELTALEQPEDEAGEAALQKELASVAQDLVDRRIMKHGQENIRCMAALSLAHILRLYAPEAPYHTEDVVAIFHLICTQLRRLADDIPGPKARQHCQDLLTNLFDVKSPLLLAMEYNRCIAENETTTKEAEDLDAALLEVFEVVLDTSPRTNTELLEQRFADIGVNLLLELESVSTKVLDAILQRLLPVNSKTNEHGCAMAKSMLSAAAERLQPLIPEFVNAGESATFSKPKNVHELIFQLAEANPNLVMFVLPSVAADLKSDSLAERSAMVTLLGRIFSSPTVGRAVAELYHTVFQGFLGRFQDKADSIRATVVRYTCRMLRDGGDHSGAIAEALVRRCDDPEPEVRLEVVQAVCGAALVNLEAIPTNLIQAVSSRMFDKKPMLRKEAMTGLARVFGKVVPPALAEDGFNEHPSSVNEGALVKLMGFPGPLLRCFSSQEADLRLLVVQLLDARTLPSDTMERSRTLVAMFHSLRQDERDALRAVLMDRRFMQHNVEEFLALRKRKADTRAINAVLERIASKLPQREKALHGLKKLKDIPDKRVFQRLEELCDPATPPAAAAAAKQDLEKRLASHQAVLPIMKHVMRYMFMGTVDVDVVQQVLEDVTDGVDGGFMLGVGDDGITRVAVDFRAPAMEFLVVVAKVFPSLFVDHMDTLEALLRAADDVDEDDADEAVHSLALRVFGLVSVYAKQTKRPVVINVATLTELALGSHPEDARNAARALAVTVAPSKLNALVPKLQSAMRAGTTQAAAVAALGALALKLPHWFRVRCADLVLDSVQSMLNRTSTRQSVVVTSQQCLVLLANRLRGMATELLGLKSVDRAALRAQVADAATDTYAVLGKHLESPVAAVRLCAARCLVKIARVGGMDGVMPVPVWHGFALTLQDDDGEVAVEVAALVVKDLLRRRLPPRYLVLPMLCATAERSRRTATLNDLRRAVQYYRARHNQIRARLAARPAPPSVDPHVELMRSMPEFCMLYAVHLLAHHPALPTHEDYTAPDADLNSLVKAPQQYMVFMLDALAHDAAAGSLSFMLQLLENVGTCEDVLEPESRSAALLAHLGIRILHTKVKHVDSLEAYAHDIFLPAKFFTPPPKTVRHVLPTLPADLKSPMRSPGLRRLSRATKTPPSGKGAKRKESAVKATAADDDVENAEPAAGAGRGRAKKPKAPVSPSKRRRSGRSMGPVSYVEPGSDEE